MKLKNLMYRLRRRMLPDLSFSYEYDSYSQAMQDSDSYEDPDVIDIVARKTRNFRDTLMSQVSTGSRILARQTTQNMFVLSYVQPDRPVYVLEFGGACGASYFELNHVLPHRIAEWLIVETPSMAAAGKQFFEAHTIKFFDHIDKVVSGRDMLDLIIAQGSLQYASDPLQTFKDLLKLGGRFLYITRTMVSNEIVRPVIVKQVVDLSDHGPGMLSAALNKQKTSQPLTIMPYESLIATASNLYNIVFSFDEGESLSVRIGPRRLGVRYIGFLAVKKD